MSPVFAAWLQFALCAALIAIAGPVLTHYADIIARLTGLSRSWIGLALLATATSLPELITGISAVTIGDVPNIAVGNVLGSCVFNLAMLVLLDELSRDEPLYRRVDQGHILTAGFGVVLIGFVGALILLGSYAQHPKLLHVSLYTPIIIVLYFVAMRAAFIYEQRVPHAPQIIAEDPSITLGKAITRYALAAAVVIAVGAWLPFVGRDLADVMGWRTSFVGTLFIAGATTLPELVVTISALRLKAVDMAIANLLGSNLFDILILALDDIAYIKGPLLSSVSPAHAISAFAATIMSGIFVVAMVFKPTTRCLGIISWASLSLLVAYVFTAYAAYLHGQ